MQRIKTASARWGIDGFVLAIIAMVIAAYYIPGPGIAEQPVSLEELAGYGVSLIFFFYGLKLDFTALKAGLRNYRLHLVVQIATFILFPLIAVGIRPLFHGADLLVIWSGICYLCALPSTVSSSVVMVSIARGNMPAAIFNASISSFIGLLATPLWVRMLMSGNDAVFDTWGIAYKLILQVLLPVALGIACNKKLGWYAVKHKSRLRLFDQSIILVIIYTSFSKSFSQGIFGNVSVTMLTILGVGMLALFALVMFFIKQCCRWLGFNHADTITAMFCGSKKSLVHGTVMSRILFGSTAAMGILLLPLMLYHALQIIAASILAQRYGQRDTAD